MGYRYRSPIIISDAKENTEPKWTPSAYTPTTWPGSRPPHVFLSDGRAIFDGFGRDWTLITFDVTSNASEHFQTAAARLSVPMKLLALSQEPLARALYERDLLLIRPDQHVAWRANVVESEAEAERILRAVTGRLDAAYGYVDA
jgi:FAD-dependent monooxygenase